MKKYVKSDYDDYDPNGPLSWDEFATLQEISEQEDDTEDDTEDDISTDLFNSFTDTCEEWCNELGIDAYKPKSVLDFDSQRQIDKFCDEFASKIYNEYINK